MFVLDEITIAVSCIVLFIAVLSPFINLLVSRLKTSSSDENIEDGNEQRHCGISVVLTIDDEVEDLRKNLPTFLNQNYKGDFQVVVVACSNDPEVENTLKMYSDNPHLYSTFIPSSSRYMSRKKLAVTLGVKAARHEWILLTDVDCSPVSDNWLSVMSENCKDGKDIVLGFSYLTEEYKASRRFDQVYNLYRQLRSAQKGSAWAYSGNNLMFRKSMFINGKGFDGNLKFQRGEYDFIVNKFADSFNTSVELSPESYIEEAELSDRGWRNKCLYYLSTRKNLDSTRFPRFVFNQTMIMMYVGYIVPLLSGAYSIYVNNMLLLIVSALSLMFTFLLRGMMLKKSVGYYIKMSVVRMLFLEFSMPMRNFIRLIRYKTTDKNDFISHKV